MPIHSSTLHRRQFLESLANTGKLALSTAAGASLALPANRWARDSHRNSLANTFATRETPKSAEAVKERIETLNRVENEGTSYVGGAVGLAGGTLGLTVAANSIENQEKKTNRAIDLIEGSGKDEELVRKPFTSFSRRKLFKKFFEAGKNSAIAATVAGIAGPIAGLAAQTPSRWWHGKRSQIEAKAIDPEGKLDAVSAAEHVSKRDWINLQRQALIWGIPAGALTAIHDLNETTSALPDQVIKLLDLEKRTQGKVELKRINDEGPFISIDHNWFDSLPEAHADKKLIYGLGFSKKPKPFRFTVDPRIAVDFLRHELDLDHQIRQGLNTISTGVNGTIYEITKEAYEALDKSHSIKIAVTRLLKDSGLDPQTWKPVA